MNDQQRDGITPFQTVSPDQIGNWYDGPETFVIAQAKDVQLGAQTYALTQPQAQQAAAVPAGWREFIENIATAGSEPLNSLAGGSDKASRRHWLGVIRDKARDLLSSAPAAPQSDDELLAQALGALQYHTEQTRPIERTRLAIEAIDRRLHGGITGGEGG